MTRTELLNRAAELAFELRHPDVYGDLADEAADIIAALIDALRPHV